MKNFIKKRWYILLVIFIVVLIFFITKQNASKASGNKSTIYKVKRQNLVETLSLSGSIDAEERVVLRFQTSGRLAWVGVKEGDYVKKYQGIASLDQRDLKKRFQKTLNDFVKERYDFDQAKDDNQRWADQSTREAGDEMKRLLEKAQYDLNNSVLDLEISQLAVEYSYLYTPIEGIVVRADSKYAGVNITPAQAEFEIINPKTLYFSFTADQTEVIRLKEGLTGKMVFDSFPDKEIEGKISYLSFVPKTGETGTVYEGKIKLTSDDLNNYKYGMTGDVTFVLSEKKNVLTIPTNYVRSDSKGKYVEKKQGSKRVKIYPKLGEDIDGDYEVISGLSESDEIFLPPTQ